MSRHVPGRLALLGTSRQLCLSASKALGKSSFSSRANPAPQLPRQLHPWAKKVVLAVSEHDGMDLIDETVVWVILNIGDDTDIMKSIVMVGTVNDTECVNFVAWHSSYLVEANLGFM